MAEKADERQEMKKNQNQPTHQDCAEPEGNFSLAIPKATNCPGSNFHPLCPTSNEIHEKLQ